MLRAAALFEHGFEIYGWKTMMAPTLATWPVETPEGATAPDMRNIVCSGGRLSRHMKGKRPKLQPGHRAPGAGKPGRKKARTHAELTGPAVKPSKVQ
jgi:D-alanyl-D-alanine carboxypeptidase